MSIQMETSCPLPCSFQAPGYDIACALSGIMGAEILYSKARAGGTRVELVVPLKQQSSVIPEMVITNLPFVNQTFNMQKAILED